MTIDPAVCRQMWERLRAESPREACGVLVDQRGIGVFDRLYECANHAPDPTKEFWMNPHELLFLTARLRPDQQRATWHSHPTSRWTLSGEDRYLMKMTGLPMAVVATMPYPSVSLYEWSAAGILLTQRIRIQEAPHVEDAV